MKITKRELLRLVSENINQEFELDLSYDVRDIAWERFKAEDSEYNYNRDYDDHKDSYLEYTESGYADLEGLAEIAKYADMAGARVVHYEPEMGAGTVTVRGSQKALIDTAFQYHEAMGGFESFSEEEVIELMRPVQPRQINEGWFSDLISGDPRISVSEDPVAWANAEFADDNPEDVIAYAADVYIAGKILGRGERDWVAKFEAAHEWLLVRLNLQAAPQLLDIQIAKRIRQQGY